MRSDDDVFDLPLGVDGARDEKAERLRIFFSDERQAGWVRKGGTMLIGGPMSGGGSRLLKRQNGGKVSGSGRAYGQAKIFGRVSGGVKREWLGPNFVNGTAAAIARSCPTKNTIAIQLA